MERESAFRLKVNKFFKILLIVAIAFIVGFAIFTFFRIKINAKTALREAKNCKLALAAADIEMYGKGKTIYNPLNYDGLEEGVLEKMEALYTPSGYVELDSYDPVEHEITGLTYYWKNYIVTFTKRNDKVKWEVDLVYRVYTFDEAE